MENIKELADQIFRDRILRARRESPGQKLFDSLELFDFACGWTEAGIRNEYALASDEEVKRLLRKRLNLQRKLEAPKWKQRNMLLP
jgi:hypothetical protein